MATSGESGSVVGRIPLLSGVANGLLAYVGGILGSLALFALLGMSPVGSVAFRAIPLDAGVGFAFYGGHFVPVEGTGESFNFAFDVVDQGGIYVLFVVVLLVASGYDAATSDGVGSGITGRFAAGSSVAIGYFPPVVAGAAYFEWSRSVGLGVGSETVVYSLPMAESVLLAGIAFPVVCGGVGGLIASQLRESPPAEP
jgi:hypothetical protein